MIDDGPGSTRRTARPAGKVDVGLLMREQRLEPESVRHLDADGAADDRCPVEIEGMVGGQLEQVAAEAVAGKGGGLDGLRRCGRGQATDQQEGECGRLERPAAVMAPSYPSRDGAARPEGPIPVGRRACKDAPMSCVSPLGASVSVVVCSARLRRRRSPCRDSGRSRAAEPAAARVPGAPADARALLEGRGDSGRGHPSRPRGSSRAGQVARRSSQDDLPESAQPNILEMRRLAAEVAAAKDLPQAARGVARLAAACGRATRPSR